MYSGNVLVMYNVLKQFLMMSSNLLLELHHSSQVLVTYCSSYCQYLVSQSQTHIVHAHSRLVVCVATSDIKTRGLAVVRWLASL